MRNLKGIGIIYKYQRQPQQQQQLERKIAAMKRVKLVPHDSTDSRESIELDEFSDEDDEVFMQHSRNGSDSSARKPLMKKKRVNTLS